MSYIGFNDEDELQAELELITSVFNLVLKRGSYKGGEYDGKDLLKAIRKLKREAKQSKLFQEQVFEQVFGDDAINKEYTHTEVVEEISRCMQIIGNLDLGDH